MSERTCSIDGCEKPIRVKSRGWCAMHYRRWQVYGYTQMPDCVCAVCGENFQSAKRTTIHCSRRCQRAARNAVKPGVEAARHKAYLARRKAAGYRRAVTEKDRERTRLWKRENADRVRALNARRAAMQRDAFVEDVDPAALWERDNGRCGICGHPANQNEFHIDHIVPLARGGEHSYRNTQIAHPLCNLQKGTRLTCPPTANSQTANFGRLRAGAS